MTKSRVSSSLIILVFLHFLMPHLQAQNEPDFYKEEIKTILSQHSPTGMAVMHLLDSLPQDFNINGVSISTGSNKNWSKYINNPDDIASRLTTTVHEAFHSLESRLSYHLISQNSPESFRRQDDYNSYFTDYEKPILVQRTEVFNSHELKELIPKELTAFRYKRYISQEHKFLSAQAHGIYGLMEEWNAYYLGNRTGVDLYTYYLDKAKKKPREMLNFVSEVGGSYFAYYEFKYFILKYLERSRYRYPEQYKALMENLALRRAFTQIDSSFSILIDEFKTSLEQIKKDLAPFTDLEIRLWPGSLSIDGSGAGFFQQEVDKFRKALAKRSLVRIEEAFKYQPNGG